MTYGRNPYDNMNNKEVYHLNVFFAWYILITLCTCTRAVCTSIVIVTKIWWRPGIWATCKRMDPSELAKKRLQHVLNCWSQSISITKSAFIVAHCGPHQHTSYIYSGVRRCFWIGDYKIVVCEVHGKFLELRFKQHPFCDYLAVKWMLIQSKAK